MSPNLKSDQDSVEANILALAQDLLSRDPTRFNSCINHNFESQSTYKGHGVELKGVSNIKHAATLFNTLDGGKAAVVKRENIAWDPESTTATIHSIRFLRPIFSPITFSLPIKTVLRFNSEDVPDVDGSNTKASKIPGESLFVTSFEDEWPIEGLVRKIPVVRSLFKSLYVPIFTFFVLTLANLVFSIQSRFTTQFHSPKAHDLTRKANKLKFKVPAPVAFKEGFEVGKNSTDKLIKGTYSKGSQLIRPPLRFLEFGLQKSTNLVNFLLPTGLIQLPWPSILEENSVDPRVDLGGGEKKEKEKEKGKERSGPSDFASALKNAENSTPSTSKKESTPAPSEKEQEEEKNVPPAQDTTEPTTTTTDNAEFNSNEIPSDHATVLVGASEVSPAKEFSIPEAQLNEDGAKPHQVKKQDQGEKEKEKKDKGTGSGKGSVKRKGGKNKERPKTLFDRIEMPKPSAEASISLVGTQGGDGNGNGNSNVESATSSSSSSKSNSNSNSSETITQSPTSPTTSTSSPILNQGSKTDEKEELEIKEGSEDSTGANATKGPSQKKKKNNKKKSGRGGKAGGGNGQAQQAQSSGPAA